ARARHPLPDVRRVPRERPTHRRARRQKVRDSSRFLRCDATSSRPRGTSLVPLALALALIAALPAAPSHADEATAADSGAVTDVPGDEVVGGTDVTGDAAMSRLDPVVVTATRTQTE